MSKKYEGLDGSAQLMADAPMLLRQRDELLAALQALVTFCADDACPHADYSYERNLIARIEEQSS